VFVTWEEGHFQVRHILVSEYHNCYVTTLLTAFPAGCMTRKDGIYWKLEMAK